MPFWRRRSPIGVTIKPQKNYLEKNKLGETWIPAHQNSPFIRFSTSFVQKRKPLSQISHLHKCNFSLEPKLRTFRKDASGLSNFIDRHLSYMQDCR